jgi:hypothetical protein
MGERDSKRFRIDVFDHGDWWEADVYDLHDHGPDLAYASVTSGDLAKLLDQATHYVLVAE